MAIKKQFSRTGKRLCCRCRKLATYEGNYHRTRENGGDWQPAKLYYCAGHAANCKDALPVAMLEVAITGADMTIEALHFQLQYGGLGECTREQAQDALWSRWPDRFTWSKEEAANAREAARRAYFDRVPAQREG